MFSRRSDRLEAYPTELFHDLWGQVKGLCEWICWLLTEPALQSLQLLPQLVGLCGSLAPGRLKTATLGFRLLPFGFCCGASFLACRQPVAAQRIKEAKLPWLIFQVQSKLDAGQAACDGFNSLVLAVQQPVALQRRIEIISARIVQEVLGDAHFVAVDLELVVKVFFASSTRW